MIQEPASVRTPEHLAGIRDIAQRVFIDNKRSIRQEIPPLTHISCILRIIILLLSYIYVCEKEEWVTDIVLFLFVVLVLLSDGYLVDLGLG